MKLRYRKTATVFIPQYEKNGEWIDFKVENVGGELLRICNSLGDLQLPRRWDIGQWYFETKKDESRLKMSIFFTKEIFVNAFLGAAQSYYDNSVKEFTPHLINL